jgi:hypothetical protein
MGAAAITGAAAAAKSMSRLRLRHRPAAESMFRRRAVSMVAIGTVAAIMVAAIMVAVMAEVMRAAMAEVMVISSWTKKLAAAENQFLRTWKEPLRMTSWRIERTSHST